jgi:hypothetical protein
MKVGAFQNGAYRTLCIQNWAGSNPSEAPTNVFISSSL